jgi:hypothetical protein
LVGKSEGKTPLGRSRHILENNIKTHVVKINYEFVDWIHLAQDKDQWRALVNTVMNLEVT